MAGDEQWSPVGGTNLMDFWIRYTQLTDGFVRISSVDFDIPVQRYLRTMMVYVTKQAS
jgi:hypothetical protein